MIELANDVDYGLAAGVVTDDISYAHRVANDLKAGNIWINTFNALPPGQPFGGTTSRESAARAATRRCVSICKRSQSRDHVRSNGLNCHPTYKYHVKKSYVTVWQTKTSRVEYRT